MLNYSFPVEIQDAYTPSGKKIRNKRAVVRTDTGDALAIVSPGYSLLPHDDVIAPFQSVIETLAARTGVAPRIKAHMSPTGSVLNYVAEFKDHVKTLAVGDKCGFRAVICNSYDGSGCTQVRVGALVLSCLNGMVKHSGFSDVRVRHTGDAKSRLQIPTPESLLEEFDAGWHIWDSYGSRQLQRPEYEDTTARLTKLGVLTTTTATRWLLEATPPTTWDFLQNVTFNLTHDRERMSEESRLNSLIITDRVFAERFANVAH